VDSRGARFRILVLMVCGILGTPCALRAQDGAEAADAPPSEARTLFLDGQSKYRHGDYEGAIEAWTAAYAIDPRPLLRYNMAQAYGRMGRVEEELEALEDFVQSAPADEPSLADARARLAALRQRLQSTAITIEGGPEGAHLSIDGAPHGLLPRPDPVLVEPGAHQVTVEAEGYLPFTASVSVLAGGQASVTVEMQEAVAAPDTSREVAPLHVALWAGGGGVLLAGVAVGAVAFAKSGDAVEGSSAADQAHNMAMAADVLMGVGAAAAFTGVILYLVGAGSDADTEPEEMARMRFAPEVGPGRVGASLVGTF